MNITPPEANTEYSRGSPDSRRIWVPRPRASEAPRTAAAGWYLAVVLAGGMLGALLLLAAEFTTLFQVHVATASTPIMSVATGSHHAYAMAVIALLAAGMALGAWRAQSRPAVLAIGALGVAALLIALLADLPDASATGLVLSSSHYVTASSTPSAGFYMETLGAGFLLVTSVWGLLLVTPPRSAL